MTLPARQIINFQIFTESKIETLNSHSKLLQRHQGNLGNLKQQTNENRKRHSQTNGTKNGIIQFHLNGRSERSA